MISEVASGRGIRDPGLGYASQFRIFEGRVGWKGGFSVFRGVRVVGFEGFSQFPPVELNSLASHGSVWYISLRRWQVNNRGKQTMKRPDIELPREKIRNFCKRNHIRKLSLFGSFVHGHPREDSDLDLLVEFDPDHIPGLIRLAGMEIELSKMLGRKVDLRTAEDLSRYFREEVLSMAEVQYAEG
jgi:hypothetical protein